MATKKISEFRRDLVSGDWVIVAFGREKRPNDFVSPKKPKPSISKDKCPFEDLKSSAGGEPSLMCYQKNGEFSFDRENIGAGENDWFLGIIPNKFPALSSGVCKYEKQHGPFSVIDGVGIHDVVVYKEHEKNIADMSVKEGGAIFAAFQKRYLMIREQNCVEYISIIHNHGPLAGASLSHPHSQIFSVPIVPPDVGRSVAGSEEYFKKNKKCVHCVMLEWEIKEKKRVVYENDEMIAIAPFVSRVNFEVRIFPKKHEPNFENISESEQKNAGDALIAILKKLKIGFNDPDFNFFIHTSPTADGMVLFSNYHWHIEILPKTSTWAGFELGTGTEIITVLPEKAAEFLRDIEI